MKAWSFWCEPRNWLSAAILAVPFASMAEAAGFKILDTWRDGLSADALAALKSTKKIDKNASMWAEWRDAALAGKSVTVLEKSWNEIKSKVPHKSLIPDAHVAYWRALVERGLEQEFIDDLILSLADKEFRNAPIIVDALTALKKDFAGQVIEHHVIFSDAQTKFLQKLPWDDIFSDLKAFAAMRQPSYTQEALSHISVHHPVREQLINSAVYNLAFAKKPQDAIKLIETEQVNDIGADAAERLQLTLGRLYFQDARLDKAEEAYLKIPLSSPRISTAREELLWVWLRKGDDSRLRGTLATLIAKDLPGRFMPDLFVVRAISNLKLCYLDEARRDILQFAEVSKKWAPMIDAAVTTKPYMRPDDGLDWYGSYLESAREERLEEQKAVLGTAYEKGNIAILAQIDAQLQREYARIWHNQDSVLRESIRKMRFVKIELMSQIENGVRPRLESDVAQKKKIEAAEKVSSESKDRWSFPYDGVRWSDEQYLARSTAYNVCL